MVGWGDEDTIPEKANVWDDHLKAQREDEARYDHTNRVKLEIEDECQEDDSSDRVKLSEETHGASSKSDEIQISQALNKRAGLFLTDGPDLQDK